MKNKDKKILYDFTQQILIHYGEQEKIDFVKNFLFENFKVADFENSYVEIDRLHTKNLMLVLVTLLIEYEFLKQNPEEEFLKFYGLKDSTKNNMDKTEEKLRKLKKIEKDTYYLEVEEIFQINDRTVAETQFIEHILDKIHVDLESDDNEDIILTNKQMIYLINGIVREWDTFKEKSLYELMTDTKQELDTKNEKDEYSDLNYIKLRDILNKECLMKSLETEETEKMKFIRDYLKDRLNVDVNKDDLIVFEPTDTNHIILLIYDIIISFENDFRKL